LKDAYGYLRVSSDEQAADGRDGLDRQRRAIQAFAEANGYLVIEWYQDDISGTVPHSQRPAFKRMLSALYGNGVSVVLIESTDRLGRDQEVVLTAAGELRRAGFSIITSSGCVLTSVSLDGRLKLGIDSTIAEYVKGQLVERLRTARQRAKATRKGYREGRKPYGTYPGEALTIETMRAFHAAGMGYSEISNTLNRAGTPARAGKWHATSVRRILMRESEGEQTPANR
jgi:site-specific DNA recombinase